MDERIKEHLKLLNKYYLLEQKVVKFLNKHKIQGNGTTSKDWKYKQAARSGILKKNVKRAIVIGALARGS